MRHTTLEHQATGHVLTERLLAARTAFSRIKFTSRQASGTASLPGALADEVGLGKTIEAGLILAQQIHRQRAHRVLILVPDTLAHQWLVEMQRRFHLAFSLLNRARLEDADIHEEFRTTLW